MSRALILIAAMNAVLVAQEIPDRTAGVRPTPRRDIAELAGTASRGERGAIVQVLGRRSTVVRIDDPREADRRGFSASQLAALGVVTGAAARLNAVVGLARDFAANTLPDVPVQLRDLRKGTIVARAHTNASGQFSFPALDPGMYAVEMVTIDGTVVALSDALTVGTGEVAQTIVQMAAPGRSFVGWVGGATSSAVNSAVSSGVLALEAGPPASPES